MLIQLMVQLIAGNITRHPAYRHYLQAFPGADQVMKAPKCWFMVSVGHSKVVVSEQLVPSLRLTART